MNILKISFLPGIIATVVLTLFLPYGVSAKIASSEGALVVESNETINDDLFISGDVVEIKGTVKGDVFAAGGSVNVSGKVEGDVYAAGGIINVTGSIEQDLIAAGGNIILDGAKIGDGIILAGGNVSVDESTTIGGGVVFGAGTMRLAATIERGIVGGAGLFDFSGKAKSAYISADDLFINETARIAENLTYASAQTAQMHQGADISGTIKRIAVQKHVDKTVMVGIDVGFRLWSFLSLLLVGILLLWLLPHFPARVADTILEKPAYSFLYGIIAIFLTPIAIVILMTTLIGIPLAFILGAAYAVLLYISPVFVAYIIGRFLLTNVGKDRAMREIVMILGLMSFYVVSIIPVIGPLFALLCLPFAVGATIMTKKELVREICIINAASELQKAKTKELKKSEKKAPEKKKPAKKKKSKK